MASRFELHEQRIRRPAGRTAARAACAVVALATALFSSCSSGDGWAVVLWPPEGSALAYGAVVPVHFMSNITKTYAVGVPGSKTKEELELWRAETHTSKAKAKAAAADYGDLAPMLGISSRDGLLLRVKPENTADQVYRLRLGQAVKLLRKVAGASVETGGEALEGDWYQALADDGTSGYVFSNQLQIWNANDGPLPVLGTGLQSADAALSALFDTVWRPDYFEPMLATGLLDLAAYQPRFGIFTDPLRKTLRVERPEFSKVYRYETIQGREDGSFAIVPGGATFNFTPTGALSFTPLETDLTPGALAKAREELGDDATVSYLFIRHDQDVQAVVAAEERRRLSRLSDFVAGGERFESDDHGVLIITRSARFTWAAYGGLAPAIIPEGAGETGSISMDLYLSPELAVNWDGAFTLRFDGGTYPAVSFAYQDSGESIILAYLPPGSTRNAVVMAPDGLSPVATLKRYR